MDARRQILREGADLPEVKRRVDQEHVNLYAGASKDSNPIHLDEEFAKKTPAGGRIAHGMLILAYVSQMMTAAFGKNWTTGGKLEVRFRTPARPGDTITVSGKVRKIEQVEGRSLVNCDIICNNQNNEPVITGIAEVKL
jgi:3-hydroxybutyryl-CoA dehydratase